MSTDQKNLPHNSLAPSEPDRLSDPSKAISQGNEASNGLGSIILDFLYLDLRLALLPASIAIASLLSSKEMFKQFM